MMAVNQPVDPAAEKSVTDHLVKLGLDLFPLVLFFGANLTLGIFWATGLCMAATVLSLGISKIVLKRVPIMALVTGAGVMIFGGMTIYMHNDFFFKIKPTVINLLFASALIGGLYFNQLFVKTLLEDALAMNDEGWRKLQWRWGLFFIFLAILNEIIWRNFSTNSWALFKLANIPLTFVFMIGQVGLFRDFSVDPQKPTHEKDESKG